MVVIKDPFRSPTAVIPKVRRSYIDGGAAGNHTVTGIDGQEDRLLSVWRINLTLTEGVPNTTNTWAPTEITAEFRGSGKGITADDTINNAGGTNTTGDLLIVEWYDHDYGEETEVGWQE